ncbi:putative multidrug resistance protein, partial [Operophtera brumata]
MVGSLVGSFGSARGAGAQIFYLLDNVPLINPLADKGFKPSTANGNIELKKVVFHYPSRPSLPTNRVSKQVLKGISLSVSRGKSVALVGQSGSGKSTVIQLIGRYYEVIDGSINIDGSDVRDVSVRWLRARIGLVGQEPVLFNVSVRENILYGRDEATHDEVIEAAKLANAHNFIVKLPKGYDTIVGERGASLSGGQKQRIAIARAVVRNPVVLLLDEATSALDTASEAEVQIALDKAAEGRTTIVVAHRLSTIRNVDVIYAMKDGEITESGSHEELMAKKGHYYEMVLMQNPTPMDGSEECDVKANGFIEFKVTDEDKDSKTKLSFWRIVGLNSPEWKSITIGCIGS